MTKKSTTQKNAENMRNEMKALFLYAEEKISSSFASLTVKRCLRIFLWNLRRQDLVLALLFALIGVGCASKVRTSRLDEAGIFRPILSEQITYLPDAAVRTPEGKLVEDLESSQKVVSEANRTSLEWVEETSKTCSPSQAYHANQLQKEALRALVAEDLSSAEDLLKKTEAACPQIGLISLQFYLQATVAHKRGEEAKARKKLQDFLSYSSAVEPARFHSVDYFDAEATQNYAKLMLADLKFYREQANKYITEGAFDLSVRQENLVAAKMSPNSLFRPGGNSSPFFLVLPLPLRLTSRGDNLYGVTIYKSWG